MNHYIVTSFYKFVQLDALETMKGHLLTAMKRHQILGTLILATEGINGSFAGTRSQVDVFYAILRKDPRFADLTFKETLSTIIPFEKSKVKTRAEIVTLGVVDVDPLALPGIRVEPEEWNSLISDPEVLVIDTRNDYEFTEGSFKNAINPKTPNFRDFPDYVEKNLKGNEDKKIAMFCTGGIRCEKSTAYLRKLGFKKVYQLEGGIIKYMQTIPKEDSLWEGKCFVFDERTTIS